MKVVQIISAMFYGDGVTNTSLYIYNLFSSCGVQNFIVTKQKDKRIDWNADIVEKNVISASDFGSNDILLYHFSGRGGWNKIVESLPCKKILVFHNVTYPNFFKDISDSVYQNCLVGHDEIKYTAGKYLRAIVLSEFSRQTLVSNGWNATDIDVFPLHELASISADCDRELLSKIKTDGWTNILFTGRVSPNKKHEDIIRIFDWYNKHINNKSRLLLVGLEQFPVYKQALDTYIKENSIQNVIFTGHISDAERNAYYEAADVFLCMSEHEGFCIPLLEAFQRKIPVIAYNATAVPDTMGNAGVLVNTKDPETVSKEIDRLVSDEEYKKSIIDGQLERLKVMTLEAHKEEFLACLKKVDEIKEWKYKDNDCTWLNIPSNQYESNLLNSQDIENLKKFSADGLVVYGFGKVGKKLLPYLIDIGVNVVAICDNGYNDSSYELLGNTLPVYHHKACIAKHSNAAYFVTVQKGYLGIVKGLLDAGVVEKKIFFYDNARKRIETM